MKKAQNGIDPSLQEFYFCTHRRKKDQSWVGEKAKHSYETFEKKKNELATQHTSTESGEIDDGSGQTKLIPCDLDIWFDANRRNKKGRVFGLGSIGRSLKHTSSTQSSAQYILPDDYVEIRTQVHALNASLQREQQEKEEIKNQNKRLADELAETNKKLTYLMQHLGFQVGSSHASLLSQSNDNDFIDDETDD